MSSRILIIAEAGVNHNGDIALAKQLVDVAADAGADLVKFQTFNADRQVTAYASKAEYQKLSTDSAESQHRMLKRLELTTEMHEELISYCATRNIGFFSTSFDIESIDYLVSLGMNQFKIPSGEITNLPYLRHIGKFGKPVILSTGVATIGDIESALNVLEAAGTSRELITVLHCTSEYPAPMEEVNLLAMQSIASTFGVAVGYSDHTQGIEVAIAAAALGATVIEKHFTLNRELPGPDHKSSLEPHELKSMVSAIRNIEIALGDGIKRVTPTLARNKLVIEKSLVASKPIRSGEILSPENVTAKRPGSGISPIRWDEIMGRKATRDFEPDELIEL
jgi:N,N'-diacetyllegionaminate synthase